MTLWTEQESVACLQMLQRGEPLRVIALEIKRTKKSVRSKLRLIERQSGRHLLTKCRNEIEWTAGETEQCLERWEQGASYSIIGAEIGKSRSAVAGRLKRLGKRRPLAALAPTERLPPYRGGWGPNMPNPRRTSQTKGVKSMPVLKTPMHEQIRNSDVQFDPSRPVATLEDRLRDGCTWPFGELPPYTFCNQQCVKGLSYCPTHCRLAYTPTRATANNGGGW